MIRQIVDRFLAVATDEGIAAALARVVSASRSKLRPISADKFDIELNIDTSTAVPLWRLKIPSVNVRYGCEYRATDPMVFENALRLVPIDLRDFTFIDIGCGKGRTLILADKWKFRRIIGIEFSPDLSAIARRNISRLGLRAEVAVVDACQFQFPDEDLLIYMYNPFSRRVMSSVIRNLSNWKSRGKRSAMVVYLNPVCRKEFDTSPDFERLTVADGVGVWRLSADFVGPNIGSESQQGSDFQARL
jgi:SAM-dependent methyltransferase